MTTTSLPSSGPTPLRLIRSEYLKVRTTNAWWLFLLGALVMVGLAILFNWLQADFVFSQEVPEDLSPEDAAAFAAQSNPLFQAANLYTSGQFFGLMFVLLVGVLIVTSEFHHQTATVTFLATPHRTAVILSKLVVAALFGAGLWLVSLIINIPATIGILGVYDQPSLLDEWAVQRSILLNLLAYVLWGILGIGLGVLIRSQIGATITGAVAYLLGFVAVIAVVNLLESWLDVDWISDLGFLFPSVASGLMVSGENIPGQPQYWFGAVVLVGWALVTGTIGTLITRRRDIS